MTRLFPALLVLSILSFLSQPLWAESEVYGGFGLGYSTFKIKSLDFEDATFAAREFLGLRYGDYVALEAGYIDFGTLKDQVAGPPQQGQQGQPSIDYRVQTSGYDLTLVGRYPLDDGSAMEVHVGGEMFDAALVEVGE